MAVLRHREGDLRRDENLWLRVTTASVQCLRISERFFHLHMVIISAKEVVISSALASLLVSRIVGKLIDRFSQNSAGKVAHEPRRNRWI